MYQAHRLSFESSGNIQTTNSYVDFALSSSYTRLLSAYTCSLSIVTCIKSSTTKYLFDLLKMLKIVVCICVHLGAGGVRACTAKQAFDPKVRHAIPSL